MMMDTDLVRVDARVHTHTQGAAGKSFDSAALPPARAG
jgi:hypothetical protein